MKILYSAISACGKVRKENQDRIYLSQIDCGKQVLPARKGCLQSDEVTFAVFDGMGGEQHGEKAAQLALQTLKEHEDMDLAAISNAANEVICHYMEENDIQSMGTTAAIIRLTENTAFSCNLGDSRIYLIGQKGLRQLSVDHAMSIGSFKPRRVLTQYLGIPQKEMVIEPCLRKTQLEQNDRLLLCSDGLTDMVADKEILQIMESSETQAAADRLFKAAMDRGGKDNISVIVCEVKN